MKPPPPVCASLWCCLVHYWHILRSVTSAGIPQLKKRHGKMGEGCKGRKYGGERETSRMPDDNEIRRRSEYHANFCWACPGTVKHFRFQLDEPALLETCRWLSMPKHHPGFLSTLLEGIQGLILPPGHLSCYPLLTIGGMLIGPSSTWQLGLQLNFFRAALVHIAQFLATERLGTGYNKTVHLHGQGTAI